MAAIISAQCAARVAPSKATTARKSAFSGKSVQARSVSLAAPRAARFGVFAADAPAKKEAAKEEEKPWSPPKLNPNTPSPIFGGSTGCLLRKAQVRRRTRTRATRRKSMAHERDGVFPAIAIGWVPPIDRDARRDAGSNDPIPGSARSRGITRDRDPRRRARGRARAASPSPRRPIEPECVRGRCQLATVMLLFRARVGGPPTRTVESSPLAKNRL